MPKLITYIQASVTVMSLRPVLSRYVVHVLSKNIHILNCGYCLSPCVTRKGDLLDGHFASIDS